MALSAQYGQPGRGHDRMVTLRLDALQAEELEKVAEIDDVSMNEAGRQAVAAYIDARRADQEFQARLAASRERNREILDRLAQA